MQRFFMTRTRHRDRLNRIVKKGEAVYKEVVNEYEDKGYAPKHAEYIAGAVAEELHEHKSMKKHNRRRRKARQLKKALKPIDKKTDVKAKR